MSPSIREEAARWCARMMGPDAELHRPAFDEWLRADEAHRMAYDRVVHRYDRAGVLAWSPIRRTARHSSARRWWLPIGLGVAGVGGGLASAAVMLLSLSSATTRLFGPSGHPVADHGTQVAAIAPVHIGSRVGEIRSVTLNDGSKVVLDTAARIAVELGSHERRLTLFSGRARFEVSHEVRPFVVRAGNGEITARGTIFDVEARGNGGVQVTLLRGAIDVSVRTSRDGPPEVRRLRVNEETAFTPVGFSVPDQKVIISAADWPSGVLDVEAIPLRELLGQANRYTAVPLVAEPIDVGELRVSGRFRVDQPDMLAQNIADLFGLTVDRTRPGKLVLLKKSRNLLDGP